MIKSGSIPLTMAYFITSDFQTELKKLGASRNWGDNQNLIINLNLLLENFPQQFKPENLGPRLNCFFAFFLVPRHQE